MKQLLNTDPADLANKLTAFTGRDFDALAVRSHSSGSKVVATLEVGEAKIPVVPVRPGTYEKERGKQALGAGPGLHLEARV